MGKNKNLRFFAYGFFILLIVFLFLTFLFSQNSAYKLVTVVRDALRNTVTSSLAIIDSNNSLAEWKLDDGFELTAIDSSGNDNDGTLINGPVWTTGIVNGALSFDGVNDYVNTTDIDFTTGGFAISVWFKTSDSGVQHVIRKANSSGEGDIRLLLVNDDFRGFIDDGVGGGGLIDASQDWSDGQWHHAVLNVNTSDVELFLDGSSKGSDGHDNSLLTNDEPFLIGSYLGTSSFFNGTIDEVQIYDRALSASEILTEYNEIIESGDTIPPTVSITSPSGESIISGTISIDATASDDVEVVGVQFKVDGSNIGNEDTTSPYSVSLDTTTLTNGLHTLTAVVRDTSENTKTSSPITINVNSTIPDTIPPAAIAICSPSAVTTGDPFPCTCSGTDDVAVASTSESSTSGSTSNTSLTGTFTYTCTVTDTSGNSASATATYTVSGENEETLLIPENSYTWTKITPAAATIMGNFDSGIGVKEIKIEVNNDAQNVELTVTKYDDKPAAVSKAKEGKVYQYLQIEATNLADKLERITIQFRVEKSWIAGNEVNKEDITIFRFNESVLEWEELATNYIGEDNDYSYYIVELESLSYFAISEKGVIGSEETGETTGEEEKRNLIWWVLMALSVLVIIIALIAIGRHIREEKQQTI